MRLLIALTAVVLMLAAGCGEESPSLTPPTAVGRWVGEQYIDDAGPPVPNCHPPSNPRVGLSEDGSGMAAWTADCVVWAARYHPDRGWLRPEPVGRLLDGAPASWLWEPSLAVNSHGKALVAWTAAAEVGERRLFARQFDPAVGWGPIDRIDGADASDIPHTEDPVQVGLDGTGNGLALWDGVFAVRFTPGTGWGPPERLSVGGAAAVLSVAPAGPAFAAWVSERLVVQRFDPAQGWGPQTRFAPEDGWRFTSRSSLALDERGRALLAWTRQRSVEYSVWAAAYESERWTALGQLNSALKTACCQLVGLAGNGHGLAVWKHLGGDVGYARFEFARGFESPLTAGALASFDFFGWSLALNTTGRGFLVSGRLPASGEGSAGGLQVSRYEDPQWRAAEPLEAGRNNLGVGVSHPPDPLAIDRCGNALVVWSSFEGGRHRVHANRFDASCR